MALNETNNKRQYTQYKRHVDDSKERISAKTVNTIQKDVNETQLDNTEIKDKAFEERVYTIFNNNLYTNAMFIDYFKDGQFINDHESINIEVDTNKRQLSLIDCEEEGKLISQMIYSVHGETVPLNDFILVTSEEIPTGADIKYYLELNNGEEWPIEPNKIKLPLHLSKDIDEGFKVVAKITPNSQLESPVINGYAILYFDFKVEENYGMTNPDLMRFP